MPAKRYGVGDVIYFRQGEHAKWHVEDYVKKIALCRRTNPIGLGFVIRAVNKLKRIFSKQAQAQLLSFSMSAAILNGWLFSG